MGMVADMLANNKKKSTSTLTLKSNLVRELVTGVGFWLIGPKLFRPEAYPICASFKLYEFILVVLKDL